MITLKTNLRMNWVQAYKKGDTSLDYELDVKVKRCFWLFFRSSVYSHTHLTVIGVGKIWQFWVNLYLGRSISWFHCQMTIGFFPWMHLDECIKVKLRKWEFLFIGLLFLFLLLGEIGTGINARNKTGLYSPDILRTEYWPVPVRSIPNE